MQLQWKWKFPNLCKLFSFISLQRHSIFRNDQSASLSLSILFFLFRFEHKKQQLPFYFQEVSDHGKIAKQRKRTVSIEMNIWIEFLAIENRRIDTIENSFLLRAKHHLTMEKMSRKERKKWT